MAVLNCRRCVLSRARSVRLERKSLLMVPAPQSIRPAIRAASALAPVPLSSRPTTGLRAARCAAQLQPASNDRNDDDTAKSQMTHFCKQCAHTPCLTTLKPRGHTRVSAASSGMVSCGKRISSCERASRVSGSSAVIRCRCTPGILGVSATRASELHHLTGGVFGANLGEVEQRVGLIRTRRSC